MKYEEIIKLIDAGYSREEIIKMSEQPEEKKPEDKKPEDKKPEEVKDNNVDELVKEMRDMFADMKKEFTAFNIMASTMPSDKERSTEDIIANIINPMKKEN